MGHRQGKNILASALHEWMWKDVRVGDTRMFQPKRHNSKQFPEAFTYPSHDFKHMAISEFLENRKIISLKFVCTHTSVDIC